MTDDIEALVAGVGGAGWEIVAVPCEPAIEALEAELVKLHGLRDQWQEIVFAPDFTAAAEAAARQYHDGECIYQQERDAYAAALDDLRTAAFNPPDDGMGPSRQWARDILDTAPTFVLAARDRRACADQIENGEEAHRG